MKVLIVEDNKIAVIGLKKIISKHSDLEIEVAVNGKIGLDLLTNTKSNLPNFILLDLNMPIMNGIELLSIIKNDDKLKCIPVIILTTSNNIDDYEKCERLGVSGYFIKEVDFEKYNNNILLILDYWKASFGRHHFND
ncbi:response regulator [Psychroserpens burtonensis]|uniref:Response regulator n=1 Tax=Psychroserpens burtonensis TaxID=49278 RepID=A0A5C7BCN2_9FLAO|nr:response regulator [Psychroserpens burtonensis]TXE20060.1 response regulator [Psychroserpens burtonensis]